LRVQQPRRKKTKNYENTFRIILQPCARIRREWRATRKKETGANETGCARRADIAAGRQTSPGSKSDETSQAHDDSQTGPGSKSDETRQTHDDNSQTGPGSKSDETSQAHDDSQTSPGSKSDETSQAHDDNSQTGPGSKSDETRQTHDYAGRSRCGSA
jgi:hypothetical protein